MEAAKGSQASTLYLSLSSPWVLFYLPTPSFSRSLVQSVNQLLYFPVFLEYVGNETYLICKSIFNQFVLQETHILVRVWWNKQKPDSCILASLVFPPSHCGKGWGWQARLETVVQPPAHSRLSWSSLLRATSNGILSISKHGPSVACLGILYQHLTTLTVKMIFMSV